MYRQDLAYASLLQIFSVHASRILVCIGARRGANLGQLPPPWNLKMMTSYAVPVENTLKFSLAPSALKSNIVSSRGFAPLWKNSCGRPCHRPSALASNTLKSSLERRKNREILVRAFGAPKNRSFLSVHTGLPPSGKIPAGVHDSSPWAPAEIFREGAKPPTLLNVDTFSARRTKIDHFPARRRRKRTAFLRFCVVFDQNIGYLMRAPKARAKN